MWTRSDLAEVLYKLAFQFGLFKFGPALTRQRGIDLLKSLVDLLANLGSGKNDFAADEDKKNNLGLDHAVDESRE